MLLHPTESGVKGIYDLCKTLARALTKADERLFDKLVIREILADSDDSEIAKEADILIVQPEVAA